MPDWVSDGLALVTQSVSLPDRVVLPSSRWPLRVSLHVQAPAAALLVTNFPVLLLSHCVVFSAASFLCEPVKAMQSPDPHLGHPRKGDLARRGAQVDPTHDPFGSSH